jgi:hypothetical protein
MTEEIVTELAALTLRLLKEEDAEETISGERPESPAPAKLDALG